jgi:hypothetical protein
MPLKNISNLLSNKNEIIDEKSIEKPSTSPNS